VIVQCVNKTTLVNNLGCAVEFGSILKTILILRFEELGNQGDKKPDSIDARIVGDMLQV
jgi:hypothetical protein